MLEKEKTPHKLGGFVTLLCIRINLTCIKKLTKNKNYSIIRTRYVLRRISVKEDKAYKIRKTFIVITLILLFATAGLFVISANVKTVTIDYYGQKTSVKTLASTVDGFLLQNKVYVNDNSTIEPSRENKIEDGLEIKVYSNNELAKFDENEVKKEYTPMIAKLEDVEESIPFEESDSSITISASGFCCIYSSAITSISGAIEVEPSTIIVPFGFNETNVLAFPTATYCFSTVSCPFPLINLRNSCSSSLLFS